MKKIYLIVLPVLFFNLAFSAPVIKATQNNGVWTNANSWNLNRIPKDGDTILIPAGNAAFVNSQVTLNNVYIKVYGTLKFNNFLSCLALNTPSAVAIYNGGSIQATMDYLQYIFIGTNTVFYAGKIAGPQIANASSGNGFTSFNPLPVKFVGFTVAKKNNDVLIQWSTAEEMNSNMYEIERSYDATNWNTIAYVAAAGSTIALNNYSYTDKNISAKAVYYRIKEVDIDGKLTYTPVKAIRTEGVTTAEVKIASVQSKVLLQFPQQVNGNVMVRFMSLSGQVVAQQTINQPVGQVVLNTNVRGNYIIFVSNGQNLNVATQVIL